MPGEPPGSSDPPDPDGLVGCAASRHAGRGAGAALPKMQVLATSREPLRVPGETTVAVRPAE